MATTLLDESILVRTSEDVLLVRQLVRAHLVAMGFTLVDQTKMITAASELARNMIDYGGGGKVHIEQVDAGLRQGVRITFEDKGPGIEDLDRALTDGYTTGSGLGLGLSGARRLVNEFEIDSAPGAGTCVRIVRWR